MELPFVLNVSAVNISRLNLKYRAFEEQISEFRPLFAPALHPSLFPFTNICAVVFRTGCTEGPVWSPSCACTWSCLEASQLLILRLQNCASMADDWLCCPWLLLASWALCHISETRLHPQQSQGPSALAVERRGKLCMFLPVCDHRPTQNVLIYPSTALEWLFLRESTGDEKPPALLGAVRTVPSKLLVCLLLLASCVPAYTAVFVTPCSLHWDRQKRALPPGCGCSTSWAVSYGATS